MHYELHVNGLDNAYTREFGCGCERCTRATRAANTSLSLIGLDDAGTVQHHVLFDAGSGILESLIENPLLRAHPRLDAVVLTHWHSDHTSELTRVTTTLARSRRRQGLLATPTPVLCRTGSAAWLERQYPHLHGSSVDLRRFGDSEPMGTILEPLPLEIPGVTITPVSTAHSTADLHPENPDIHHPCCAGYILEFGATKIGLLWDLDATNLWLEDVNHPVVQRLRGADHVFFDSNTWRYDTTASGHPASHASFSLIQRFARTLEPRCTWLVHLSGHEDAPDDGFGWDNARWQSEARRVWAEESLPGEVRVPEIGERIAVGVLEETRA